MPPKDDLTSISHILYLTHHRNKNQHRLAKWYKAFSILRRQVAKLISELEALETASKFSVRGGKKREEESKYVKVAREKVEDRVVFMEDRVVESCFLAFSNLVADNQYAALGLVLMGTLARVKRVIRPLGRPRNEIVRDDEDGAGEEAAKDFVGMDAVADLGEVVKRDELGSVVKREVVEARNEEDGEGSAVIKKAVKKRKADEINIKEAAPEQTPPVQKPKKKRKKGGDAFDDLFSSLI